MANFGLEAIAGGEVRKCEVFTKESSCPSCQAIKSGRFLKRYAQSRDNGDGFIQRTCRGCNTTWREFSN